MDRIKIIRSVIQEVVREFTDDNEFTVESDTPLLSSGLLSSLQVVDVILRLEALGLFIEEVQVEECETINDIARIARPTDDE